MIKIDQSYSNLTYRMRSLIGSQGTMISPISVSPWQGALGSLPGKRSPPVVLPVASKPKVQRRSGSGSSGKPSMFICDCADWWSMPFIVTNLVICCLSFIVENFCKTKWWSMMVPPTANYHRGDRFSTNHHVKVFGGAIQVLPCYTIMIGWRTSSIAQHWQSDKIHRLMKEFR